MYLTTTYIYISFYSRLILNFKVWWLQHLRLWRKMGKKRIKKIYVYYIKVGLKNCIAFFFRDVNLDVVPQYAEFLSRNNIKGIFGNIIFSKIFTFIKKNKPITYFLLKLLSEWYYRRRYLFTYWWGTYGFAWSLDETKTSYSNHYCSSLWNKFKICSKNGIIFLFMRTMN